MSVEIYLILVTVFSVVFGAALYFQARLSRQDHHHRSSARLLKSTRLIDWIILIAITGLLTYLVR